MGLSLGFPFLKFEKTGITLLWSFEPPAWGLSQKLSSVDKGLLEVSPSVQTLPSSFLPCVLHARDYLLLKAGISIPVLLPRLGSLLRCAANDTFPLPSLGQDLASPFPWFFISSLVAFLAILSLNVDL